MHHSLKPVAALLVAVLLSAGARAQATDTMRGLHIQEVPAGGLPGPRITLDGPRPKGPLAVIYVDGQRCDSTKLAGLNPSDIATVSVLKADVARRLGPEEAKLGVLVLTTKAGEHSRAVRAFDKRLRKLGAGPPAPATSPK